MQYVPFLLMGGFILLFVWVFWQTSQFKKFVNNAVLCTFITAHGTSFDKVLPVQGNKIMPPTGMWMKKKDKLKDWGEYNMPSKTYTCMYPLGGWPAFMKVEVKRVFLYEISANTFQELDTRPVGGSSPQAQRAMRNTEVIASVLKPEGEIVRGATASHGASSKDQKRTFYLQLATLAGLLIVGVICWMIYSALSGHITAWGA